MQMPPDDVSNNRPSYSPKNNWEQMTIEKILLANHKEQITARRWRIFFRFFYAALVLLVLFFPLLIKGIKLPDEAAAHIGVVELSGVIDSNNDNANLLLKGMEKAYQNQNLKGIIIKANSPGGSPVISGVAYNEILNLKKKYKDRKIPIYVVVEDVCASGCYYIASAADKIYADQASLVGSIGVISGGFGFSKAIEKLGIERRLKTAGNNKGMGDPFSPETPEQQEIWQTLLNEIHQQFISAVSQGRGKKLKSKEFPEVFSGQVFSGSQGLKNGLIDGLGNIYSVNREEFKDLPMVDYSVRNDNFANILGKGLRSEVKQGIDELSYGGW